MLRVFHSTAGENRHDSMKLVLDSIDRKECEIRALLSKATDEVTRARLKKKLIILNAQKCKGQKVLEKIQ